ncbi:DUF4168 domain-containing protein [Pontibacter qinzhouensis]|uniref:DUF4168 domain-containing protein n=1 Tax=Pontibacter qinzhouensis TaxID=2603253 RepID=A0A5C8KE75_9BACT|nr:DUF4168 domain-containing protein [Pontibacter qinzhouensis]TXK52828.1 DUF4168 domain-containing protein [Pontibacter qinzhouensis]
MKLQNKFKGMIIAALTLGLVSFSDAAFAQQTTAPQASQQQTTPIFTEVELQQFIDASERIMVLQQENEKAMLNILEEEKLDVNKFNELAIAYQEERIDEAEATQAEKEAFTKVAERIIELQPTVQAEVQRAIEQDGMTMEKYEKVMMAYQEDPSVQAKIQSMLAVVEE